MLAVAHDLRRALLDHEELVGELPLAQQLGALGNIDLIRVLGDLPPLLLGQRRKQLDRRQSRLRPSLLLLVERHPRMKVAGLAIWVETIHDLIRLSLASLFVLLVAGAGGADGFRQPGARRQAAKAGRPLVIAHRGASGYRPEHTLAAYRLGRAAWARTSSSRTSCPPRTGCWSPATRTRSAAPRTWPTTPSSPAGRTTKTIDGVAVTGWFTEDFTLAELKTLRAKERIPDSARGNTALRRAVPGPTFQEVIDLPGALSRRRGRRIGIYPETKHPTYFRVDRARRWRSRWSRRCAATGWTARRAGVHPVVRDREPAGARPLARRAAGAAARHAGQPALRLLAGRRPAHLRRPRHAGRA